MIANLHAVFSDQAGFTALNQDRAENFSIRDVSVQINDTQRVDEEPSARDWRHNWEGWRDLLLEDWASRKAAGGNFLARDVSEWIDGVLDGNSFDNSEEDSGEEGCEGGQGEEG